MKASYTASDIRILEPEEVARRWFWAKAGQLALQYRRPESWIERGLLACESAQVPHDYFIDRYLKRLSIPMNPAVNEAFDGILREADPSPARDAQKTGGSKRASFPPKSKFDPSPCQIEACPKGLQSALGDSDETHD